MSSELLFIWSERPALSLAIWLCLLVTVMYLGRSASHQLLRVAGRSVYHAMRLFARALNSWQASLAARNQRVLLSEGKAQLQRTIEREFVRVQSIIARDLSHYPTLHRQTQTCSCDHFCICAAATAGMGIAPPRLRISYKFGLRNSRRGPRARSTNCEVRP